MRATRFAPRAAVDLAADSRPAGAIYANTTSWGIIFPARALN